MQKRLNRPWWWTIWCPHLKKTKKNPSPLSPPLLLQWSEDATTTKRWSSRAPRSSADRFHTTLQSSCCHWTTCVRLSPLASIGKNWWKGQLFLKNDTTTTKVRDVGFWVKLHREPKTHHHRSRSNSFDLLATWVVTFPVQLLVVKQQFVHKVKLRSADKVS